MYAEQWLSMMAEWTSVWMFTGEIAIKCRIYRTALWQRRDIKHSDILFKKFTTPIVYGVCMEFLGEKKKSLPHINFNDTHVAI